MHKGKNKMSIITLKHKNANGEEVNARLYCVFRNSDFMDGLIGILNACMSCASSYVYKGCEKSELQEVSEMYRKFFPEAFKQLEDIRKISELKPLSYPTDPDELERRRIKYEDGDKYNLEILEQVVKMEPRAVAEIIWRKDSFGKLYLREGICEIYGMFRPLLTYAGFHPTLKIDGPYIFEDPEIRTGANLGPKSLLVREIASNKSEVERVFSTIPIQTIMSYKVRNSEGLNPRAS